MTRRNKTDKKTPQARVDDEAVKRDPVEGPENGDDTATLAREAEDSEMIDSLSDLRERNQRLSERVGALHDSLREDTPPNSPFSPGSPTAVQQEDAPGPGAVPEVAEDPEPAPKRKAKAASEDLTGIELCRLFDTSVLTAYEQSGNEGEDSDARVSLDAIRAVLKERQG